jgi:hypothetical protein
VGLFYLTATLGREQITNALNFLQGTAATPTVTIIIGMRPENIGRVLGIGVRVAGRVAGQRLADTQPRASAPPASIQGNQPSADVASRGRAAGQATTNLGRGLAGFFKPFRRVGGALWLEVTGVFFFLPVLVFTPTMWRTRLSFLHGPDHRTFIASTVVVVLFLYLSVSSFYRARRR